MSRSASLDKCFYIWDVDKKEGTIPVDEVSRVLVTYRGAKVRDMCKAWVDMIAAKWEVGAALQKVSLRADSEKRYLQASDLKKAIINELSHDVRLLTPLGTSLDWASYLHVTTLDRSEDDNLTPPLSCFFVTLTDVSPIQVPDIDETLQRYLTAPAFPNIRITSLKCIPPKVPPCGLKKNPTRQVLLDLSAHLSTEEFEDFVSHILATHDFVYDCSQHNQRNRMLWELFMLWDANDHGYIDSSDFTRRLSNMKCIQERQHINVPKLVEQTSNGCDDISLTRFKVLVNKLLSECTEADFDTLVRTLRRQLEGDEDTKDNRYAVCRHLKSEAERQSKRDERLMQMAERRSSFSCATRDAAMKDIEVFRKARLESKKAHAFDSVTFDDIAVLLDTSIAPPAARLAYERVASAVCILLDVSPVTVDSKVEYWPAFQNALRGNMIDILSMLNDINIQGLSHVRVSKCMTMLQESSNPSHLLSLSWFLSALAEWCTACCELACLHYTWEWPPPLLQSSATNPTANNPRPPTAHSGSGVRSLKYRNTSKPTDGHTPQYQLGSKEVPKSPFRASNLFARRRRPKGPSWVEFSEKQQANHLRAKERSGDANSTQQDALVGHPANLNEEEAAQYKAMCTLNESLGLPQLGVAHYTDHANAISRPYWDDGV